jgi:NitT/TauT family transport system substrate-binding protein
MQIRQNRRDFLAAASLAAAAGVLGPRTSLADDGPLETTTVRLLKESGICDAPLYVAEALLRADGFTDVQYIPIEPDNSDAGMVADGKLDFSQSYAPEALRQMDLGKPLMMLAGVHPGCHYLFAREPINGIKDLKGRRVAVPYETGYSARIFLFLFGSYIGLDPARDITWVTGPEVDPVQAFVDGQADALYSDPFLAQRVQEQGFDRIVFSTATDRPWSQYFCCMIAGNASYVRNYPNATKRVVRAVLKSADFCLAEPERAARMLVDGQFFDRYDFALRGIGEVPYAKWREYDPEDTLRFYALRLYEVGLIKTDPNTLIAEGTDWRFLDELKRELKA